MSIGFDRYLVKRRAGISTTRKDGSKVSVFNDEQSAAAEKFAAEAMGCQFNDKIFVHGDGGKDFSYSLDVEVIWLGVNNNREPRLSGNLIVNPDEPHRWADIYIVVRGSTTNGFEIIGWTTHNKLETFGLKNFGYGPKMFMPTHKLFKIEALTSLKRKNT
jgi:hypothetical protein